MNESLYDVLGVPPNASADELDRAFRALVRRHHPDLRDTDQDTERLRQILAAYAVLRDADRRRQYDHQHDRQDDHQYDRQDDRRAAAPAPVRRISPPLRAGPVRWHRRFGR
jgi:curved DNA-binding protein CbpA